MAMSDHPGRYTARETLAAFHPSHAAHSPIEVDEFKTSTMVKCSCGARLCITLTAAIDLGWSFAEVAEGFRNVHRKAA